MYYETKKHFLPPPSPQPFWIELTGTSYCDATYRITRTLQASNVFVLEYIIAGEGTILINGKQYEPSAGDFYLLQPGCEHEYFSSAHNPWTKVFANVYGSLCDKVLDAYGLSNTLLVKNCNVEGLFREFIMTANSLSLTESQIMAQCAARFVEIVATVSAQACSGSTTNKEAAALRDFLNANTHRSVSVKELSGLIYHSCDYTIKLFKRVFGSTPYDYQIQRKMDICKRRLCTSHDSIASIAYDMGYTSPQHFSKQFRAKCGVSPKEYRKRFLAGEEDLVAEVD